MCIRDRTDIPAWNHARYLLASSRYPVYDDSQAVYFPSGERCFARMLEELEQAEHYIFLEFFIINNGKMWDAILDVLRRKAWRTLRAALAPYPGSLLDTLHDAGHNKKQTMALLLYQMRLQKLYDLLPVREEQL